MKIEYTAGAGGSRVALVLKDGGTVVLVDGQETFAFDLSGRFLVAGYDGAGYRRGMDNRLLRVAESRRILGTEESRPILEGIYRKMARLAEGAPPEASAALSGILGCGYERLAGEALRFGRLYGSIPVLPPDQYQALYLQVTLGCAFNRCAFCVFYRDRDFRVRSPEEFEAHLGEVEALFGPDLGRRTSIFLGEANALAAPVHALAGMMRRAAAALPGRPFASFGDPLLHRARTIGDLRELGGLGLARVTLGLETGHPALYARLGKPGAFEDLPATVERIKSAGIGIGLTVLVGLGGRAAGKEHVEETADFLLAQPLGAGDYVYLSPLCVEPGSDYTAWAAAAPGEALSEAEIQAQMKAFQGRLRDPLVARGARLVLYDVARFLYA